MKIRTALVCTIVALAAAFTLTACGPTEPSGKLTNAGPASSPTPTGVEQAASKAAAIAVKDAKAVKGAASTKPAPTTAPPVITLEQKNADQDAADYLDTQGFSRTGLIKQLQYDKYSKTEATKAVDGLHADWNAEAVRVAEDYLSGQAFSHQGLISQLEYDGFTKTQATYGAKGAGL